MKKPPYLLLGITLLALGLAAWGVFAVFLVGSALAPAQRDVVRELLAPQLALVIMSGLITVALAAIGLRALIRRYIAAPQRLLEQTQALLTADSTAPSVVSEAPGLAALAEAINGLAQQRQSLRQDMALRVEQASRSMEAEKNRLAALMSELSQSVVVCNQDGRIVLYNNRARSQFRRLPTSPSAAPASGLIGIGRSIYAVLAQAPLEHALDNIRQQMTRGANAPSTQFVTGTAGGQLWRVQMAPVRASVGGAAGDPAISGYVLMLDDVTTRVDEEARREQLLHGLTEGSRASLANLQAAVDILSAPDLEPAERQRFLEVVREEVGLMSQRITALADGATGTAKARWSLEEMSGNELLPLLQRTLAGECRQPVSIETAQGELWLRVDSFSLGQAVAYLARRLVDEFKASDFELRLQVVQGHAQLDLAWTGQVVSPTAVAGWELTAMRTVAENTPLTVRDVLERHGGEIWFEPEPAGGGLFRLLLPLAGAQEKAEAAQMTPQQSRPEFYDFDLFQATDESRALEDRPLLSLAFTVFDTETTGLNPSQGDEIIQIAAVRIVNGKLLHQEVFDQLVDPGRSIPPASVAVHHITPQMVSGKPGIVQVLPAFHVFAQDTVLVAHNAAFDMRFLQLKEDVTGLVFHQPVLDTLLLSALAQPNQTSHSLDAIAVRFNIPVVDRHSALGDALVTAEVLLRLLPLLHAMGIHNLRQARQAAQKTYYARLKY
jgi:DNA polymerase-3 subunit epsilon